MVILIDKEVIDFTIEAETTVGEVVDELKQFLSQHQRRVSEIVIDDAPTASTDESWKQKNLEEVGSLNIHTMQVEEASTEKPSLSIQHLSTIVEYLDLYVRAAEQEENSALRDLASEFEHVSPALPELVGVNLPLDDPSALHTMTEKFLAAGEPERPELKHHFVAFLKQLKLLAEARLREHERPIEETVSSRELMRMLLPKLSDVSVLLQAGKDAEAMQHVAHFTELAAKLLRLIPRISADIDTEGLHEFAVSYHSVLGELMKAFGSHDSVLIGDLLEYEITPYSEELIRRLDSLSAPDNN
ncbi:MAG: hypothetical protein EA428_14445 [Spirochaetaceae bacterium]|nr:MAG: hypothetical protein EA428_14445 [Spirochaetaceae bacterium]